MIPSAPRTLGGTSFRQVVKAGKCGYRMAIFFRRMQMQISEAYWMQNEESACRRRRKRQCQRRRRIWRCGLRPSIRHCPRGWSQYLQRMGPPLRARFFAPQLVQTHCTRAPSGIYSPTVRFSKSILRFCRYPLPMSDWSCSRALPEERTVPSRSKVRLSSVSGTALPRCGARRPCGMRGEECERSASRARQI